MWWWWRTGIKGQMHACRPFGFMSLPHSWHRDPHACCRFAHMSLTRVPACLRNDCRGSVHMAACGESAAAALCLHAYWSQHVLFRYHPPQISQPGLICSRWQHHTLLHARIHKCVHTHTSWISVSHRGDVFSVKLDELGCRGSIFGALLPPQKIRQTRANFARAACGPSAPPPTLHTDKHESNRHGESCPNP